MNFTKFFLIGAILASANAFALTDEEAEELGMTKVDFLSTPNQSLSMIRAAYKNESGVYPRGLNILVNERDLDKGKTVLVVNKGIRNESNPEGQTLKLYIDGRLDAKFDVSTGVEQLVRTTSGNYYRSETPQGYFRISRAHGSYFSNKQGAAMHQALFFNGGIAIHSTTERAYKNLGKRASHGCTRMTYAAAEYVNKTVRELGGDGTNLMRKHKDTRGWLRENYLDRIELPDIDVRTGEVLDNKEDIWTYDSVVIVTATSSTELNN